MIGGPQGDTGLTGRKIIVDTYGGYARHGGGAFSGKDPSKVDRSAAYYARYIAKHVVAAGLARRCEVQFAYAIGVAEPVSMLVDTFGTGVVSDEKLTKAVLATFDARPGMLIQELDLRRPIFRKTAAYGHFGREERRVHVGEDAARREAQGARARRQRPRRRRRPPRRRRRRRTASPRPARGPERRSIGLRAGRAPGQGSRRSRCSRRRIRCSSSSTNRRPVSPSARSSEVIPRTSESTK